MPSTFIVNIFIFTVVLLLVLLTSSVFANHDHSNNLPFSCTDFSQLKPDQRIICENTLPGNPTSEWDINAHGDPSIQGFSTDISFHVGTTASFKINTSEEVDSYRVDIFRMGYYNGLGARKVATIHPTSVTLPFLQPPCRLDPDTYEFSCRDWKVTATWDIPADAASGVYIARPVRTDNKPRSLQRCSVLSGVALTKDHVQALSKVHSLTELDLGMSILKNNELDVIVNYFPSLETLATYEAEFLDPKTAFEISSPPPPITKSLRSLTMKYLDALFAIQFVPHFPNLRTLVLSGAEWICNLLDLRPLSSSLPLVTDLALERYTLENSDSLKNLVHLSTLHLTNCKSLDLSFLTQDSLPELTTLGVRRCTGLVATSSLSFASLSHAPNLRVLAVTRSDFDNDCLQYLDDMAHLRKLDLTHARIVGDSRVLKTLMQNLFQLEELNVMECDIGNKGAIAGALYSTHSRLRVLNLRDCNLVDDDLKGIGALKNTLEVLDLTDNFNLTTGTLVHCKALVKLKKLKLQHCKIITDLSPLKDCSNLEELDLSCCYGLCDASFRVFSEEPNSFPNFRVLHMLNCNHKNFTEMFFEHLSNNNNIVSRLKELNIIGMYAILSSSSTARKSICQLKGLRRLTGFLSCFKSEPEKSIIEDELMRNLKNLDDMF